MNTTRLSKALAVLWLALLWPAAAGAAEADTGHAYLAKLTPTVAGDTLSLRLWVRGEARNSVAVRPDGVQVTLEGAFLDPAKQHLAVDHPAIREVFAYQYDPDTVRVRVVTEGLAPGALRDHVALRDEGRSLVLTVSGLKGAEKPAPVPAAGAATATAPEPIARPVRTAPEPAAPPAAVAPVSTLGVMAAADETSRPASARAAAARAEALATLERLLGAPDSAPAAEAIPAPAVEADGEGAGMQALNVPRAALLPARKDGGGAPAEAGAARVAAPGTKPAPAVTEAAPAPTHAARTAPPAAPAHAPAPSAETAPVPLRPLPGAASARPDLWSSGIRMAGGLLLVLGLLAAGVAVLRRVRGATLGGRMPIRVLATASLGSRQNIVVVEVEGRRLVVGVTPGGMELLADLSASGGPGGDTADGTARTPETGADSPFARALARAGERDTADALHRTTRDLQRRVRRLKARSA